VHSCCGIVVLNCAGRQQLRLSFFAGVSLLSFMVFEVFESAFTGPFPRAVAATARRQGL
jgi:hypothetical protein